MNTQKILSSEVEPLKIASLPTRPTAPSAMGGKGYTPAGMKEAFDKLPLLIIERFNSLIDDICTGAVLEAIQVSLSGGITLSELVEDIGSGNLASYLTVQDASLAATVAELKTRLSELEEKVK